MGMEVARRLLVGRKNFLALAGNAVGKARAFNMFKLSVLSLPLKYCTISHKQ
jgi:hypothetical protein